MASLTAIRVALDWTPNTNHTGLYLALHHNLYSQEGLDVQLLPPDPTYSTTPAKRLEAADVDLALVPSESIIAYRESLLSAKTSVQLQAIYAILQHDASAIASCTLSSIRDLGSSNEGRKYGSYAARYEDAIVRSMVDHDGGDGAAMKTTTAQEIGKFDLFNAVKKRDIDATWIFTPWEGVEADDEGVKLSLFRPGEYGVPYGYSPVIVRDVASQTPLSNEVLKAFVKATTEGYRAALRDPDAAAIVLGKHCTEKSVDFLVRSQMNIARFYGDESSLGVMDERKWDDWIGWLKEKGLVGKGIEAKGMWTNEFFK